MGTGGTLPTKITQSVTLYNTTGFIEREKGIYFCPFILSTLNKEVRNVWLEVFRRDVHYISNYSDMGISNWNPKDRSLVIKGNVDDFRVVTEEGYCFNYLILTRNVWKSDGTDPTETHYYGFFITDVVQAGNGSVRLTLESDDFTNVFYLHNKKLCNTYSGDYIDVFNENLKNCYVARQHYNRVKRIIDTQHASHASVVPTSFTTGQGFTLIQLNITNGIPQSYIDVKNIVASVFLNDLDYSSHIVDYGYISLPSYLMISIRLDTQLPQSEWPNVLVKNLNYDYVISDEIKEDNLPIFSQIEEGFKYKRQVRDYKEFVNYGDPLTDEEKEAYEEAESWNDLSNDLKIKALKLSTAFFHLTLNTSKISIRYSGGSILRNKNLPNTDMGNSLMTLCYPILLKLPFLSKFYNDIADIFRAPRLYLNLSSPETSSRVLLSSSSGSLIPSYDSLASFFRETSVQSQYVISAHITRESSIKNRISYYNDRIELDFYDKQNNDYVFFSKTGDTSNTERDSSRISAIISGTIYYTRETNTGSISFHGGSIELGEIYPFVMFQEKIEELDIYLPINNTDVEKNLKTEYFDTVLTFNPYSFWSVSYLGRIEVPLNKLNYYEGGTTIHCKLTIAVSDVLKYNFVPVYEIDGKEYKYYTESIEQTISSELTVVNANLSSYLMANKAQMKNQYAVNDLNHEYGLITTAIAGVGNIAGNVMKGNLIGGPALAGAGAITGGVQMVTSLISEGIDWGKDEKQIAMNQKAKLADMGNLPNNLKQVGTDINIDLINNELGLYLNHYHIDEVSYNSICKYLERFGYVVNIYDTLHVNTRKGWDFVQLVSFDYETKITVEQEESIRQIFEKGVTLLHDESYMRRGHNYEIILD